MLHWLDRNPVLRGPMHDAAGSEVVWENELRKLPGTRSDCHALYLSQFTSKYTQGLLQDCRASQTLLFITVTCFIIAKAVCIMQYCLTRVHDAN